MISFLFSFKQPGGVPTLFKNIASDMAQEQLKFRLIAYKDSEIFRLFEYHQFDFEFVNYSSLNKISIVKLFKEEDILILTYWDALLPLFINVNPRVLFWNVFPNTLINSNLIYKKFTLHFWNKLLIKRMLIKEGLVFMDDAPLTWLNNYHPSYSTKVIFLPIPVQVPDNSFKKLIQHLNFNVDLFKIIYIARSEEWKLYPLLKIIYDLRKIEVKIKIILKIVSDNKNKVAKFLYEHQVQLNNEHLIIECIENIKNENLKRFILENAHLNIGMGTACLEGASVGVPSLLINPSYSFNADLGIKWLYNVKNFNLGSFDSSDNSIHNKSSVNLNQIISELVQNSARYEMISEECYQYVNFNHNLKKVSKEFQYVTTKSQLRVKDVVKFNYAYSALYWAKNKLKAIINI